jgi:hypothetical protein
MLRVVTAGSMGKAIKQGQDHVSQTAYPELVEGTFFSSPWRKQERPFDKLRADGVL